MSVRSIFLMFVFCVLAACILGGCRPICLNVKTALVHVGTPARGADVVLQVAQERRPCVPKRLFGELQFAGTITWREAPWNDGVGLVAGTSRSTSCSLDVEALRLEPAPKSALAHEIGHWFWNWCFDRVGEVRSPEGRVTLDADLVQWIDEVNTEATRRLMEQAP